MTDSTAWFGGLHKLWFVGAVSAFALLWSLEIPFFLCHPHLQLLIREVAFALLISCVFGLTIEEVQRKAFIKLVNEERRQLKRDVFLYAYGSNIPDEIRQEMRSCILDQPFYRHSLVVDWEFSPVNHNADLMVVQKRYSYTVINNSKDDREWPFSFGQTGADDLKAVTDAKFVRLRITRGIGTPNTHTDEYKASDMKIESSPDQPHTKRMSKRIPMKPDESMGVYYEVGHVRRLYGDDKYSSKEPIVGVTKVRLRFPPNFEVQVACKTRSLKPSVDHDPPVRYSLEWTEGMLPFTGVTISWSKKEVKMEGEVKTVGGQERPPAAFPSPNES